MSPPVTRPQALRTLADGSAEFALLDVREEGDFARGHLLLASNAPLGRLELLADAMVPRPDAPVILCDADGAGGGPAERAAAVLAGLGYRAVSLLDGGVAGAEAAGLLAFTGVHVISKAFGEVVVERCGTPAISPADLEAARGAGEDLVVLDSRPWDEYRRMAIPGGINVPGADLVYRIGALAPDPATRVVVNCAGRTRSIIGAQSLINAGVPNRVAALEGGTMAWELAGLSAPPGDRAHLDPIDGPARAAAIAQSRAVAARWGVDEIDADGVRRSLDAADRTTYLLDVRLPQDYAAGHLPDSRSAPGGQLVQETDRYAAVRNARLVLVDDAAGVRGRMTGSWLRQMGWPEVFVYPCPADRLTETTAPAPPRPPEAPRTVSPEALEREDAALVIDLCPSPTRRAGHVPGSVFVLRARVADKAERLRAAAGPVVLVSEDGVLAAWAAADLRRTLHLEALVLDGGLAAWRAAGLPVDSGPDTAWDPPVDVHPKPYDHDTDVARHMRDYLSWEVDLPGRVARDGSVRFRL